MKAANILETIGNTPHIRINRLFGDAEVWVKSERANPGASIKDRIALSMIEEAERSGTLRPDGVIIEPTSGNTGIGLAMVAAVKGYRLILTMPESMSLERRALLKAYGAEVVVCPTAVAPEDPRSYYNVSDRLAREIPGAGVALNASSHSLLFNLLIKFGGSGCRSVPPGATGCGTSLAAATSN